MRNLNCCGCHFYWFTLLQDGNMSSLKAFTWKTDNANVGVRKKRNVYSDITALMSLQNSFIVQGIYWGGGRKVVPVWTPWRFRRGGGELDLELRTFLTSAVNGALPLYRIATCYGLDGPVFESRWGKVFRIRPDRPWGPPSLLNNGCWVFFPGVKRPGRVVNHPPPFSAEVKEGVELYLYSPSGSSWPVLGRTLPCVLPLCP